MTTIKITDIQRAAEADQRPVPRVGSKLAILVELLSRDGGAAVEEMTAATGWQAHTVRGVMSGALAKKFGLAITSEKIEGRGRVYRVVGDSKLAEPHRNGAESETTI